MKRLTPEILRWIITGFFVVSAVVFLPSLASGLMLGAAILTAPLPKLDEVIRDGLHLKKTARIAIVTIIFFAAAMMTPAAELSREATPDAPTQSVTSQTQLPIQQTTSDEEGEITEDPEPAPIEDDESRPAVEADEPQPEDELPVNAPAADPAPVQLPQESAVEPVTPSQPVEEAPVYTPPVTNEQGYTVYVTNTGSKYHRAGCRHLKDSQIAIDINDAIAQGYTACKNCGG